MVGLERRYSCQPEKMEGREQTQAWCTMRVTACVVHDPGASSRVRHLFFQAESKHISTYRTMSHPEP
jgi:hypothetical protein